MFIIDNSQTGRAHLLLISRTPGKPGGAIGVLTLEDIIDEILSEEIVNETDQYSDNMSTQRAKRITTAAVMQRDASVSGFNVRRGIEGRTNTDHLLNPTRNSLRESERWARLQWGIVLLQLTQLIRVAGRVSLYHPEEPVSSREWETDPRVGRYKSPVQGHTTPQLGLQARAPNAHARLQARYYYRERFSQNLSPSLLLREAPVLKLHRFTVVDVQGCFTKQDGDLLPRVWISLGSCRRTTGEHGRTRAALVLCSITRLPSKISFTPLKFEDIAPVDHFDPTGNDLN
ncbi:hypothetical protein B0H13DRAFT_1922106 [Mycena leptocephala]|nr:hypothetical protein B0H13DRAFT_1922106 [Mycena leptocephala]